MRSRAFIASLAVALMGVGLALAPASAKADGAFPDSLAILLPQDRPDELVLATNFGLLSSADAGATWRFVCERVVGPYAAPYQLGPPPDDRIFAVTYDGLALSADRACNWRFADATFTSLSDVFPDPTNPARVFAIASAIVEEGGRPVSAVFESTDGGESFGAHLYAAPTGAYLTGVEVARTDPATVFLSMYGAPAGHAVLVVTHDAGETWETVDLSPSTGSAAVRIAAVDPEDATRLFLRVQDGTPYDRLAIVDDSGASIAMPLTLETQMTAFLRRADGVIIVGSGGDGGAFWSDDDGATFVPWPNAPHLRALGERDGHLVAVGDNFVDDFAVASSDDDGASWQPLLRYDEIAGPLECGDIPATCETDWADLKLLFGIGDDEEPPEPTPDPPKGCDCSSPGTGRTQAGLGWLALCALAAVWRGVGRHVQRR